MTGAPPTTIDLGGRVALVTGAGRGIGAATAGLLARAGASLALCDRLADPLEDTVGALDGSVARLSEVLDVREPAAVDDFVARVEARFGRVDILVNNAGGSFQADVLDVTPRGEAALIAENFSHVAHLVRRVVPLMPDGGAIVQVTSVEAHQAAPGFGIYAAMKAGLASLTRTLALELAPRGIRVNAMAPDALLTPGEHEARLQVVDAGGRYVPAMTPPLGFGTPDDGAAVILFLVSDLARFVTGTTVHVDGGTWAAGGWQRRDPAPDTEGDDDG